MPVGERPDGDPDQEAEVDNVRAVVDAAVLGPAHDLDPLSATEDVDHAALRRDEHQAHTIAGAIYGTILASTVVASLGHDPAKLAHSVAIVLVTSLVFWAAHVYSLMVAGRMVVGRPMTRPEMRTIAVNEWPMLQSSVPILIPLLLGVFNIISKDAAATIALLVGIGALFVYGVLLGLREGRRRLSLVWNALVVGSFGVLILLLKLVVH